MATLMTAAGSTFYVYDHTCHRCGRKYRSSTHRPLDDGCGTCTAANRCAERRYSRIKAQTSGKRYDLAQIAFRDGWTCHICGKPVDPSLNGRDPMGPTADHLVPVAHGGGSEPSNVALAHRRCNVKRGTRGNLVQLMLIGD